MFTCDADIAGLEVGHDLLGTTVHGVQDSVRNRQLAVTPARALAVEVGEDVG